MFPMMVGHYEVFPFLSIFAPQSPRDTNLEKEQQEGHVNAPYKLGNTTERLSIYYVMIPPRSGRCNCEISVKCLYDDSMGPNRYTMMVVHKIQ